MQPNQSRNPRWALAIHGGAGAGREEARTEEREDAIRSALSEVLAAASERLAAGAAALDAVEDAVRRLEDSPLFNAGRGSVLNERGEHELEASIMDGRTHRAGAAAVLRGVKNPISLARRIMEHSPHVFLQGEGALAFAVRHAIELVDPAYFGTERRWQALKEAKQIESPIDGDSPAPGEQGTVGAVALDVHGDLAAATSTGGVTNKAVGRIGDSSIIGAGTYASNATCAVSCTGQGEYFIRATAARDIAALMEYSGLDAQTAADRVIETRICALGGEGGVIVVDRDGRVAFAFNTYVMLRGCVTSSSPPRVDLYAEREEP